MIGVVLSYLTLALTASVADPADEICAMAARACEPILAAAPGEPAAPDDAYATPAKVVCAGLDVARRTGRIEGAAGAWACDRQVVIDLWYRMSRTPDSERPLGALRASRESPLSRGARAACNAPEGPRAPVVSAPAMQPLAIFAVPMLAPPPGGVPVLEDGSTLFTRASDPPERPPRRG
jgi:hypothetical protein